MRLEVIKSFVLILLVAISLLLTFGLWSNSPTNERIYNASSVNEVDIGGISMNKRDVINPSQVTFHTSQEVYGLDNPKKRTSFLKDTGEWELSAFEMGRIEPGTMTGDYVEVILPTELPLEYLPNLYTIHDEITLPDWSFNRVYFILNQKTETAELKFVSADNTYEAIGQVNNPEAYDTLKVYFTEQEDLIPFETVEADIGSLYLPKEQMKMSRWTLSIEKVDDRLFVNALFSNPSTVWKNAGEAYYSDGQRGMRISEDRRSMEFINPLQLSESRITATELLTSSIDNINEHKGWTDAFNLFEIDLQAESVKYQMYYDGNPVFNTSGLATIQQQWREGELYNYRRPLFELTTPLTNESVLLPSGVEIYQKIKESSRYKVEQVRHLQPAYRLDYHDDYSSVTLEPSWYMIYNGVWQEVLLDDIEAEEED